VLLQIMVSQVQPHFDNVIHDVEESVGRWICALALCGVGPDTCLLVLSMELSSFL
jgi:hypothetical protein